MALLATAQKAATTAVARPPDTRQRRRNVELDVSVACGGRESGFSWPILTRVPEKDVPKRRAMIYWRNGLHNAGRNAEVTV